MNFAPLHFYSGYSYLQSGLSVAKIVSLSKKAGYSYCGISDISSMSAYPEFDKRCVNASISPIFGIDLWIEENLYSLFIENEEGYLNLISLLYLSSAKSVNFIDLKEHLAGIKVVLNSDSSFLFRDYESNPASIPARLAKMSKDIPDLILSIPYLPSNPNFITFLREFLEKYPYSSLAFPHFLYEKKEDAIALAILHAIGNEEHLEEKTLIGLNYFLEEEVLTSYYTEKELADSVDFASSLHFQFKKKRGKLLQYPCPNGMSSIDYLKKRAYDGLKARKPDYNQDYVTRLEYELKTIIDMGYADYFLVVEDYVSYAKNKGILVGPSRGSAAGSLVAYALSIVLLDPIEHGLLFERFLNPKRQSLPDIDIDFEDIRREEIVSYLREKYGKSRVSYIITMQTLGAKASLRDVGRVYQYPNRDIDLIAKCVEFDKESLGDNYRHSKKFKELVDSDPYYLQIVGLAHKIEGLPRQSGIHAAGVILNDEPLVRGVPILEGEDGMLICQYDKDYIEEQGFLKMDLLALRNLTIIDRCLEIAMESGLARLSYSSIPHDDPNAISLIRKGRVMGLFQLESRGMQKTIANVQPTSFDDVAAVIALFRPGPMDFIPSFSARKHGQEPITYPVKELETILAPTYGIIVYQEQIMQIVRLMAGFDFGQADLFRKAISKKNAAVLGSLKDDFISGCLNNGFSKEQGEMVFALIDRFANYGFPKAHSYGYAVITCQMAYLKYYYEIPFYCAILDEVSIGDEKFNAIKMEMQRSNISFLQPDINKSGLSYHNEGRNAVRLPLMTIRSMNSKFLHDVIDERLINGPYEDLFDFALRTKKYGLKQDSLIRLIDAGCFDSIYPHRASLRLSASSALSYAELFTGEDGQSIMLDLHFPKPALKEINDTPDQDLQAEKEAIGMMLSASPLQGKMETIKAQHLWTISQAMASPRGGRVAGIISNAKSIKTKSGSKVMFVSIFDKDIEIELTVFARDIDASFALLKPGQFVSVFVRSDSYKNGSFIGSDFQPL